MDIQVLSDDQKNLISIVLDCLIPPDDIAIGAGEAGTVNYIYYAMSKSNDLHRAIQKILSEIEYATMTLHGSKFEVLKQDHKIDILTCIEKNFPQFFEILVEHTYKGYYSNKDVLPLLGVGATPPQPRGYSLPSFDKNMLENVRRRGKRYRDQK